MATSRPARSQSIDSHDMQGDSDQEHEDGVASQAGPSRRKGKGKATKESDRKAQNRIAQREFRQRKQAYIKELEAKVKMQELGKDEQVERLGEAVRTLLDENDRLRQLLAGLSGFIGEGLGGALPRLKTTLPDFERLISRSYIDTATGALGFDELGIATKTNGNSQNRPHSQTVERNPAPTSLPPTHYSTYPPPDYGNGFLESNDHTSSSQSKSQPSRSSSGPAAYPASSNSLQYPQEAQYSLPAPISAPPPHPTIPQATSSYRGDERDGHRFSDGGQESEVFARWCMEKVRDGNPEEAETAIVQAGLEPTNNNAIQAMQLISYHMKSKREHPEYNLPPSLKATPTQTLVPHSPIFDGIIFPSLRDRLILLKDQYPLEELTKDLIQAIRIHGNDLLLAENWEVEETFLRKYWFVIDETVLNITNKWRKERGDKELDMKSIVPDME
ncbi:hypothetical protein JCM5350_005507 [Sporobolomyces pararoseus]